MGNSFVIRGLRDEAAYEQRDVDIRQTRVGERPDENEVAETKTQKSVESHSCLDSRVKSAINTKDPSQSQLLPSLKQTLLHAKYDLQIKQHQCNLYQYFFLNLK